MSTLEVHPEIHTTEQPQYPTYVTCQECHRSFRPQSEDQLSLALCDSCFEAFRHRGDRSHSVRVKVLPRGSAGS
jgi:uncharacterized UBP type Zn finger protein